MSGYLVKEAIIKMYNGGCVFKLGTPIATQILCITLRDIYSIKYGDLTSVFGIDMYVFTCMKDPGQTGLRHSGCCCIKGDTVKETDKQWYIIYQKLKAIMDQFNVPYVESKDNEPQNEFMDCHKAPDCKTKLVQQAPPAYNPH
jgi:hypothetical protein